jgi:threonine synthase
MGLIGPKRPKMIVVQAEGCAPLVRAFERGEHHAERWANATTIAPGIRVPAAIADYLILSAVRESNGTAITVSDIELLAGMRLAARHEGLFVAPESGAAVSAAAMLRANGFLDADEETVIFSTGTGLKHIDLIAGDAPVIDPRSADLVSDIARVLPSV